MAQTTYSFPVESINGTLSSERHGDTLTVHRRKCFGKTKDGTPIYGPCETYTYHCPKNQWGTKITKYRELFKLAQKQTVVEMADPERLAKWQTLFEEQLNHPKPNEKQYIKLQCYIAAQLLKEMKAENNELVW